MRHITPCLWFDTQAEDAANFYVSLFKDGKIITIAHYTEHSAKASKRPVGSVMTVLFEIMGQQFLALNGGPVFSFNPAVSMMVPCETQEQIDRLWTSLLKDGGEEMNCGWVKDKYGLCWQIVPSMMSEVFKNSDKEAIDRWMAALMQMNKLDIPTLQAAYSGASK